MHVLLLPKWYPGTHDPQLGDFIRKQAIATSGLVRMSVMHLVPVPGLASAVEMSVADSAGLWELEVRYRATIIRWRPARKASNLIRYWRASLRGWQRVRLERGLPDLIHAYILVRPALFAWYMGMRHRRPFIISEQSSEYIDGSYAAKGFAFHALSRFLFRKAKAITAVSHVLGEALRHHRLCANYEVTPNVVPGLDRPLPVGHESGLFMMVADLVDRTKNISGVLRALATARLADEKAHLAIIGDGPDRAMLEQLTVQLGLSGRVRFLGRMANAQVLDHLANAQAVIINSNVETFSVVTGEALAQGKPVIATRCGGPQAFITPENGVLIDPRDDDALAKAMLDMIRGGKTYDAATVRGTIEGRFSPQVVGEVFNRIYKQAVS